MEIRKRSSTLPGPPVDDRFTEIVQLIQQARQRAVQTVNTQLIELYWQVGAYISSKLERAEWGTAVVNQLADYLGRSQPGLRGFTRSNLFKMCQFYETYQGDVKVSALPRLLSWTNNCIILAQCKTPQEREYYLRLAVQEQWSSRELERQLKSARFERHLLNPPKVSPAVRQIHPGALEVFRDSYLLEFLDLPPKHQEQDLHKGLLLRLKDFLSELGRDFCFIGTEYPLQVGSRDFALDLQSQHCRDYCYAWLKIPNKALHLADFPR